MPQPVVTYCAFIALDIGILLGITGLDMRQADAALFRPQQELAADVLRPVVAMNNLWFATPFDYLIQRARTTRSAGNDRSISMAMASRLKSSITLNKRKLRPSAN